MAPDTIKTGTLIRVLLIITAAELLAAAGIRLTGRSHLEILGVVRILQIAGILWAVFHREKGLGAIGWSPSCWSAGLIKGAWWSMGFGVVAGIGMAVLFALGHHPIAWLRSPLPENPWELALFFLVGGLVAPVAEEICFRGVVYTYMRGLATRIGLGLFARRADDEKPHQWIATTAVVFAIAASSLIFAILHAFHAIPITQTVGGIVFAVAFETSRNLTVPMVIHILGNLAIFTLSLV